MPGASLSTHYLYDRGGREGGRRTAEQAVSFIWHVRAHMSGISVRCASGSGYTPHPRQQPGLLRVADAAAAVYSSLRTTSRNRDISPMHDVSKRFVLVLMYTEMK